MEPKTYSISDFNRKCKLGKGSYGNVYLVEYEDNLYGLKEVNKDYVTQLDKSEAVFRERNLLSKLKFQPAFPSLVATFQDDENLYFLIEYVENGCLSDLIEAMGPMPVELARHYAAELVEGICQL